MNTREMKQLVEDEDTKFQTGSDSRAFAQRLVDLINAHLQHDADLDAIKSATVYSGKAPKNKKGVGVAFVMYSAPDSKPKMLDMTFMTSSVVLGDNWPMHELQMVQVSWKGKTAAQVYSIMRDKIKSAVAQYRAYKAAHPSATGNTQITADHPYQGGADNIDVFREVLSKLVQSLRKTGAVKITQGHGLKTSPFSLYAVYPAPKGSYNNGVTIRLNDDATATLRGVEFLSGKVSTDPIPFEGQTPTEIAKQIAGRLQQAAQAMSEVQTESWSSLVREMNSIVTE